MGYLIKRHLCHVFYSSKCALTRPEATNCNLMVKITLIERLLYVGEDPQAKNTSKAGFPPDLKVIQLHIQKPVKSIMCDYLVLLHLMRIHLYICLCVCVLPNNSLVIPARGKDTRHTETGKRKVGSLCSALGM